MRKAFLFGRLGVIIGPSHFFSLEDMMLFVYRILYKLGLWMFPLLVSMSLFSAWLLQQVYLLESDNKAWWVFGYLGWLCFLALMFGAVMTVESGVSQIVRENEIDPDLVLRVMSRNGNTTTRMLASLAYNYQIDFMEMVELYERTCDIGLSPSRFYWALEIYLHWPNVSTHDLVEAVEKYKLHRYEYHKMSELDLNRWLDNQRYDQ